VYRYKNNASMHKIKEMGNNSGKYQDFYAQNMNQEGANEFDLDKLDPLKVLKLPKNYTWLTGRLH
jgi:hypothetical protein